jgi:hypothetical protein
MRKAVSILIATIALCAATAQSAAACSQWDMSRALLRQSNEWSAEFTFDQNGTQLHGTAWAWYRYQRRYTGDVEGTLIGDVVRFSVNWYDDPAHAGMHRSAGIYEGRVDAYGFVSGQAWDRWNPQSRATWNMTTRARCVR